MRQRQTTLPTATPSRRQGGPFFPGGPGRAPGAGVATAAAVAVSAAPAQPFIQRQPAPAPQPAPQAAPVAQNIPDPDRSLWVGRVDDAMRKKFGLTGAGLNLTRVRFVDEPTFAASFPAGSIAQKLLELFLSPQSWIIYSMLRHHHMAFASPRRLAQFVADRIAIGNFEEAHFDPRSGSMVVTPYTPRELLAMNIGGVTDVAPAVRGARRILMQTPADVETLVHEACHFYVSNGFKLLASTVPNRGFLKLGVNIEHTLMEGFAEYFARQVMRDNAAVFGPLTINAYQPQVEQVWRYVTTIGQSDAVAAYFHGNAGALGRLKSALAKYETTPLELIEPWP